MNPIDNQSSLGRRRLKSASIVLLVLVALGFASRNLILGKPVQTFEARRGDLVRAIAQRGDAFFNRWMRREQRHETAFVGDAARRH